MPSTVLLNPIPGSTMTFHLRIPPGPFTPASTLSPSSTLDSLEHDSTPIRVLGICILRVVFVRGRLSTRVHQQLARDAAHLEGVLRRRFVSRPPVPDECIDIVDAVCTSTYGRFCDLWSEGVHADKVIRRLRAPGQVVTPNLRDGADDSDDRNDARRVLL
ncbi:hypothetical protein EVJ58_g8728 [Rhodofomes roseus]|uniref:Uncharacterized protein n=1 Tax=Rhodofomes roseus TaxID=34475 RepID=A0A4Y9XWN3_9APHY|nr:hypothetical protein EVJ58_g8728 [Rhodofomes roseus]